MRIGVAGTGRIGSFHAETLRGQPEIESIVVADVDAARARQLAEKLGVEAVDTVDELFTSGIDALVITAATSAHAGLIRQGIDAGVAVFCEKPVSQDVPSTRDVLARGAETGTPVQIGFQRRFDRGYGRVREAVRSGELGWIHTMRAMTADASPPPAAYVPLSGGLYRDCSVHDFDIVRWVTGAEVESVYALGSNQGEKFFGDAGDVDTAVAALKLDNGILVTVSATRYNGAGHDVRLEVCGSAGGLVVGLDDRAPLFSAEPSVSWQQAETPYQTFLERFHDAYLAELRAFVDVVAGRRPSPCTVDDALQAFYIAEACQLSQDTGRPVRLAEVKA
ncbi:Gfo/Idh/MocA family oxidoreductase [Fodinicola acaciae]|uniref:Gfo/Idh/MocA family oxidoreductase n=1 Tax=Fodinicola acaciae TaxID=2681555 RepID=UPI001651F850|nr:Gfo/Idh/MocA family oxidoreductase [Fodinicola acaciae]